MTEETGVSPGALPLLQYSLGQLWRAGELTLAAYRTFGGVRGALEQQAERVYADPALSDSDRLAIRELLLDLVQPGEGSEDTRRRVPLDELTPPGRRPEQIAALVKRLAAARLITTADTGGQPTVEVSHEALIRGWSRLRGWLDQDREALRTRRQLGDAARLWAAHHEEASYLYGGSRLAQAEEWARGRPGQLGERERAFLEASLARRDREAHEQAQQARQRRRARFLAGATGVLTAVALLIAALATWAFQQRSLAIQNSGQLATANVLLATANAQTGADRDAAVRARQTAVVAQTQVAQLQQETRSRQLAEASASQPTDHPYLALLLAIEAKRRAETAEADSALRQALAHRLVPSIALPLGAAVTDAFWSRRGDRLFTRDKDDVLAVWDAEDGRLLASIRQEGSFGPAALSPDETRAVTQSDDGTALVWDVATGALLFTLRHDDTVWEGLWSHDGGRILTSSSDGTAKVWDATTGALLLTLRHGSPVWSALWSADDRRILGGATGPDGKFSLWDAVTGEQIGAFERHGGQTVSRLSRDGSRALLQEQQGDTLELWNTQGTLLHTFKHLPGYPEPGWSRDEGRLLTHPDPATLELWDARSGARLLTIQHAGTIASVRWNAAETRILTAAEDGSVKLWDARAGTLLATMQHDEPVYDAKWDAREARILTIVKDGPPHMWDAETGALLFTLAHDQESWSADWSPDGEYVSTRGSSQSVLIWEAASGTLLAELQHPALIGDTRWGRDASTIFTTSGDHTFDALYGWALPGGKQELALPHNTWVNGFRWNPDQTRLVTWNYDGQARLWLLSERSSPVRVGVNLGHAVINVVWKSDGSQILAASEDYALRLIDAQSGVVLLTMRHDGTIRGALWSADETRILAYSDDGTATVWDAATGAPLLTLRHASTVWDAQWSTDERQIMTSSDDGTAKVWDATTGTLLLTLHHDGRVSDAQWNRAETRIMTRSFDATAKVWDARAGKLLLTLQHGDLVTDARWSSDEGRILTSSIDGTAKIWDAASGALLHRLEAGEWVGDALWSPDDTRVLTRVRLGVAFVWDARSGERIHTLLHSGQITEARWSHDGSRILAALDSDIVTLWDATTGDALYRFEHRGTVRGARWSADEARILTVGSDGTAKIWDAATGTLRASVQEDAALAGASWSPDESSVVTYRSDGTITIHAVVADTLLAYACRFAPRNLTRKEWAQYLPGEPYAQTCPGLPAEPELAP